MNIKFASLSLIITAVAGLGFVQSANANDEDGQALPQRGMTRFNYGLNNFQMDPDTGGKRRVRLHPIAAAPAPTGPSGNVTPGSVPKMALDPTFLAPPKPVAVVPTIAPAVKATILPVKPAFTAIPSSSPFKSIFGNPQPLVAKMEKPLSPMTQQPQQQPQQPVPPASHAVGNGTAKLLTPQHHISRSGPAAGGLPSVANYGSQFYTPGTLYPHQSSGNGMTVDASVTGVVKHH